MFPKRLKELRTEKGISQRKLADALGLSNRSISVYEQGVTEPSIKTLVNIANYFDVTVDYLIGNSDSRSGQNESLINELGLSDKAIDKIREIKTNIQLDLYDEIFLFYIDIINGIFTSDNLDNLLEFMSQFILFFNDDFEKYYKEVNSLKGDLPTPDIPKEVIRDAQYTTVTSIFSRVLDDLCKDENLIKRFEFRAANIIAFKDENDNLHSFQTKEVDSHISSRIFKIQ